MLRRTILLGAVLALACGEGSPKKKGPFVAEGKGVQITAAEFKARLEEQSPFLRARYSTLERKKEFLQNLVNFELLAKAAEKEGLANDPDVQLTLKKVMVQKLVAKKFGDPSMDAAAIPEAELQAYYDAHKDDFFRAQRVRVAVVAFNAPEGSPDRAKKLAAAKKARETLAAADKKNPAAFAQLVAAQSEDVVSKASGGDLGFKTQSELEKSHSKAFADAVFALEDGQLSNVLETPNAVYVAKVTGHQDEVSRPFEAVKTQLANKLSREKKTKELEAWKKSLIDEAGVKMIDAELEKVEIAAAPAGGMPGGHGGMMGGGMPRVTPAQPAPAGHGATPAPAPATK
jgi:peptidyl-prolyl cis-trans isomerase C